MNSCTPKRQNPDPLSCTIISCVLCITEQRDICIAQIACVQEEAWPDPPMCHPDCDSRDNENVLRPDEVQVRGNEGVQVRAHATNSGMAGALVRDDTLQAMNSLV